MGSSFFAFLSPFYKAASSNPASSNLNFTKNVRSEYVKSFGVMDDIQNLMQLLILESWLPKLSNRYKGLILYVHFIHFVHRSAFVICFAITYGR